MFWKTLARLRQSAGEQASYLSTTLNLSEFKNSLAPFPLLTPFLNTTDALTAWHFRPTRLHNFRFSKITIAFRLFVDIHLLLTINIYVLRFLISNVLTFPSMRWVFKIHIIILKSIDSILFRIWNLKF